MARGSRRRARVGVRLPGRSRRDQRRAPPRAGVEASLAGLDAAARFRPVSGIPNEQSWASARMWRSFASKAWEIMSQSNGNAAETVAILGVGNLGRALAVGWTERGPYSPERVTLTRRRHEKLAD